MKKIIFASALLVIVIGIFWFLFREKKPLIASSDNTAFCLTDTLYNKLELDTAKTKKVHHELLLEGKVSFNQDNVVNVYPLVGGFIKNLYVNLGDFVKKGQVLAVIRSPEVAGFRKSSDAAQADLKVAEKNYTVAKELYETGTISEVDLLEASKAFETAKAELHRSDEVLDMYNSKEGSLYKILAPETGFIVAKDVVENMELRTEDIKPIFTISNLDTVWVMANIYESDIPNVKVGYEVDITTIAYKDEVFKGKIDKVFNVVDPESKVLKARIVLSNPEYRLKPEMYTNVVVKYEEDAEKITINSSAVIFDKNAYFVVVYKDRCQIATREIEIYKTTASTKDAYLSSGLNEGEKVITKNHLLIYNALK